MQFCGTFRRLNPFSRFLILWLRDAPNFSVFFFFFFASFGPQAISRIGAKHPAGRNSQKSNEKLGATPNQRIKKRESGFVVVKAPFSQIH